jgi:hypothetical protein
MRLEMVVAFAVGLLAFFGAPGAFAGDACSLLTTAEVESAVGSKVTSTTPSVTDSETGCLFQLGRDRAFLSYFTDAARGPKFRSMKEDPFMRGAAPPNGKDYGNVGCKVVDAQILISTNCDRYQPRLLRLAVQSHSGKPVPMDVVKGLLDKAGSRLK